MNERTNEKERKDPWEERVTDEKKILRKERKKERLI